MPSAKNSRQQVSKDALAAASSVITTSNNSIRQMSRNVTENHSQKPYNKSRHYSMVNDKRNNSFIKRAMSFTMGNSSKRNSLVGSDLTFREFGDYQQGHIKNHKKTTEKKYVPSPNGLIAIECPIQKQKKTSKISERYFSISDMPNESVRKDRKYSRREINRESKMINATTNISTVQQKSKKKYGNSRQKNHIKDAIHDERNNIQKEVMIKHTSYTKHKINSNEKEKSITEEEFEAVVNPKHSSFTNNHNPSLFAIMEEGTSRDDEITYSPGKKSEEDVCNVSDIISEQSHSDSAEKNYLNCIDNPKDSQTGSITTFDNVEKQETSSPIDRHNSIPKIVVKRHDNNKEVQELENTVDDYLQNNLDKFKNVSNLTISSSHYSEKHESNISLDSTFSNVPSLNYNYSSDNLMEGDHVNRTSSMAKYLKVANPYLGSNSSTSDTLLSSSRQDNFNGSSSSTTVSYDGASNIVFKKLANDKLKNLDGDAFSLNSDIQINSAKYDFITNSQDETFAIPRRNPSRLRKGNLNGNRFSLLLPTSTTEETGLSIRPVKSNIESNTNSTPLLMNKIDDIYRFDNKSKEKHSTISKRLKKILGMKSK